MQYKCTKHPLDGHMNYARIGSVPHSPGCAQGTQLLCCNLYCNIFMTNIINFHVRSLYYERVM